MAVVPESTGQSPGRRFPLRPLLGTLVSVALLVWLARRVDFAPVMLSLARFSPGGILLSFLLVWLTMPLRALQWRELLGNPPDVPFTGILRALCLGYAANAVLPMRGGEVVRAYALARTSGRPVTEVLPSVALARVLDLPMVLLLFAVLPFTVALESEAARAVGVEVSPELWRQSTAAFASTTVAAGLAIGAVLAGFGRFLAWLLPLLERLSPRVRARAEAWLTPLVDGLRLMGRPRRLLEGLCLAGACWVLFVAAQVPLLMAFGVAAKPAWEAALAITALTTAAYLLPSAPGAVGTFHAFCAAAVLLSLPETSPADAVAYAVVAHLVGLLAPVLPGLAILPWRRRKAGSTRPQRTHPV